MSLERKQAAKQLQKSLAEEGQVFAKYLALQRLVSRFDRDWIVNASTGGSSLMLL